MPNHHYETPEELLDALTPANRAIVERVRAIFKEFFDATEQVKVHGLVRKFSNRTWWYCNAVDKKAPILWCSHVHHVIRRYPFLSAWFDQTEKYVGKIFLYDRETIDRKAVEEVVRVVSEMGEEE